MNTGRRPRHLMIDNPDGWEKPMSETASAPCVIEVSDETYDLLQRTATSRGTDINGALRYLLAVPPVTAETSDDADEE